MSLQFISFNESKNYEFLENEFEGKYCKEKIK